MIEDFLKKNPSFYNKISETSVTERLHEQALNHTSLEHVPKQFLKRRPNESPAANKYAIENYRRLTHELFDAWLSKSGRIFNKLGFKITKQSSALSERLSQNDIFKIDSGYISWSEYIQQCLYPESIINPNQLFFLIPYTAESNESPITAHPANEFVPLEPRVVSLSDVAYYSDKLTVFKSGKKNSEGDIFFAIDTENWYRLIPRKDNHSTTYDVELWYPHKMGYVPNDFLPGKLFKDSEGKFYRKSILATAFEHLDEAVGLIKDDQAITTSHAYPHLVMASIPCDVCEGTGYLAGTDEECQSCNNGYIEKPPITGALVVPNSGGHLEDKHYEPIIDWKYPGVDIMKHLSDKSKDTLNNAFRSVGLRSFLDVSESGEAKKYRLEDLLDRLEEASVLVATFAEKMLLQIEHYCQMGDIVYPKVSTPKAYHAFSRHELNELIKNSKGNIRNDYVKSSYLLDKGDTELSEKIIKVIQIYAPLANASDEEIRLKIGFAAYSKDDIIRADYAFKVIEKIARERDNFLVLEIPEIMNLADRVLVDWGVLEVDITSIGGEQDKSNKLRETVGGVTAAIQVNAALARKEITEVAAENFLIEFYGFSREKAQNLIDVPSE